MNKMKQSFFKRWGKGIKTLPMSQQLHAKMIGHVGAVVGMILAIVVLSIRGVWYFLIFLFFIGFLQALEFLRTYQQYKATIQIEKTIKEQEVEEIETKRKMG